ncbi:helix-turn-helix transcriptional regulator [Paenibacillus aceris]|uniref:DNA-binding transcriptional regulator YafY n=1 Tax=Paenibacillus aceris TaxID=869555 RepID=A0ABS4I8H6_9BACL|nr:WYL domain-containing protein [Paenibacillus aceris]MBP1966776.1 putative DNA-binding transcriptional regulator YafY [Paenibacillus aceris]NHW39403.1 WYL domain-containing protein [Paenibacillus aceris]
MSKADQMLAILWLIKSHKRITAKQLAEKLEIHIRTVYRYIDALCASGVPIISDSGHHGGYRLLGQFNEAPLVFDLDEQKALIHAAAFALEAGYPFGEKLNQAVTKLKIYTNQEQLEQIYLHEQGLDVILPQADAAEASLLREVEVAVVQRVTLHMHYQKGYGSATAERHLDPYGLVCWKNKCYVVGHCHLRQEIRSFRVDRIRELSRTDLTFERPVDFSARQFILAGVLPDSDKPEVLVSVKITGREQALDDLCGHWFLTHALVERTKHEAHFQLQEKAIYSHLPYQLLSYGGTIQIKEPKLLIEMLMEITQNLHQHYASAQID